MVTATAPFEPPGPGQWALDRSHFPGGTTPILEWLMTEAMAAGMTTVFAEIGVPARCVEARFVHGFMYTRLTPLIGGDKPPSRLPPKFVLRLVTRLHPAFRARTKAATAALTDRNFVRVAHEWETSIRPTVVARNREWQDTDLDALDDVALEGLVRDLLAHLRANCELHFYLHGHDLGPIARYLHSSIAWGLDPVTAASALAGASPSTSRPLRRLVRLRELVEQDGRDVTSLADIRAISPEADALVDEHLREHGRVLATGYDLTSFTLEELPGVLLDSVRSAVMPVADDPDRLAAQLRDQVPTGARAEFDDRLADARTVMDMRDDNGPVTVEWPLGLLRHALIAMGRRLVARGSLLEADHALELTPEEARSALTAPLPGPEEIQRRSDARVARKLLDPPLTLGPAEPEPPLDAMPGPLADLVAMVQTALTHLGMDGATSAEPLTGLGIGRSAYTGRARTAGSAEEAFEALEPGDVLIVRATSPAYNAVLTVAGAVVTANGGALSHAAVLARELDIPAVVGVSGALAIPDGSQVTVDPVAGRVTVHA